MKPRALLAELVGTFMLTLGVFFSVNNPDFAVSTPGIAAATLGLLVYVIGPVSGCHINPAVTAGVLSIGRIRFQEAAGYIIAQFAGAGLALAVGSAFVASPTDLMPSGSVMTGFAELVGAAVFVFAIAAVVVGRVPGNLSGVVIGAGFLIGISFAAHTSAGVLNPAVALGIGSFSLPYIWGPVAGGILGALLGNFLSDPDVA